MTERVLGVGIVGCGQATQSIHIPTLLTLADRFRIVACMDVNAHVAEVVGDRAEARSTTELDDLLSDPAVEVVAICSPDRMHAEHVERAANAGKRAILCEKPLATTHEELEQVRVAHRRTGVPVIVGTMHRYDPGFREFVATHADLLETASMVRSTMFLMPNRSLVDASTQLVVPDSGTRPMASLPGRGGSAEGSASALMFRMLVLSLAIHHLPLIRVAMPTVDRIDTARLLGRTGFQIRMVSGDRVADLTAIVLPFRHSEWTFELWGDRQRGTISFPPSYLRTRSAAGQTLSLEQPGPFERTIVPGDVDGYVGEWLHLHDVVTGKVDLLVPFAEAARDLELAFRIIDAHGAGSTC